MRPVGRPVHVLTDREERAVISAWEKVGIAEENLAKARRALVKATKNTGKPQAVARLLGVSGGTIQYWLRQWG